MPLILNKYENSYQLSLWSTTEPLIFFESKAHLSEKDKETYNSISSSFRRKEWLAVRVLLNEILGFWPIITYSEKGNPILQNDSKHLSITHTKNMVGVLLSTNTNSGIDIEHTNRNIEKVISRFLSPSEQKKLEEQKNEIPPIVYWCAKEAIFKATDESDVLFSEQIAIEKINRDGTINGSFKSENKRYNFLLHFQEIEKHIVVWTV